MTATAAVAHERSGEFAAICRAKARLLGNITYATVPRAPPNAQVRLVRAVHAAAAAVMAPERVGATAAQAAAALVYARHEASARLASAHARAHCEMVACLATPIAAAAVGTAKSSITRRKTRPSVVVGVDGDCGGESPPTVATVTQRVNRYAVISDDYAALVGYERRVALADIEHRIIDLTPLFERLQTMIDSQAQAIDVIERNIDAVDDRLLVRARAQLDRYLQRMPTAGQQLVPLFALASVVALCLLVLF